MMESIYGRTCATCGENSWQFTFCTNCQNKSLDESARLQHLYDDVKKKMLALDGIYKENNVRRIIRKAYCKNVRYVFWPTIPVPNSRE